MKMAILSNINFSPIKNVNSSIYLSGISEYYNELVNQDSQINKYNYDVVFCFIDVEELIEEISVFIDSFIIAIKNYLEKNSKTLFIMSNFYKKVFDHDIYLKNRVSDQVIYDLNVKLKILNDFPNFYIFDMNFFMFKYGYKNLIAPTYWYLGRIKFNLDMYKHLFYDITNIYNAYIGKTKKLLILDLDNTLWGGVLGEDGIEGIKISEDGEGKIYRDLQKNIKKIKDYGILLAIVSKNNYSDVEELFNKHPMMVLKFDDFIIKKINWNPKPENIKEIAKELNLGIDSFVFIDDSNFERNLVREMLPECSVPEFPDDISYLNIFFFEEVVYKYFPKLNITKEDLEKSEQYVRNFQREALKVNLSSIEDYIVKLNIKLTYYINDKRFIHRISQLTQKTNQFNLTTKRYTEADILSFLDRDDVYIFALEYEDRFGKEGIVGLCITFLREDIVYFDTFLLSCRIIGRDVEFKFINYIIDYFKLKGFKKFEAEYIPTNKNHLVRDFYLKCDFVKVEKNKYYKEIIA